ncbi:SHOCT domain-containing protein [Microbacterium sp. C7(2022)]|uniref:SHOCT domain-containing protein n=1 Tax=Microbacterium sp. C7(2022) TaxID=2992759 RepID=UPI00237AA705|nr:SHOCT domain-containing protein [Microbacterium sp. C7(2022)]MDE0546139.1 SHOCT domain-containing protein [Microbacterium sp. C7(2022)]
MSFWDFLLWMLWIYLAVMCIWIFIWIFIDLFRDHTMNGWGKAGWVILLVFLPFLGALIYLIARGRSMSERQMAQAAAVANAQAQYVRDVAGTSVSPSAEIEKAQGLLASGTITQAEFDALKAKALAG